MKRILKRFLIVALVGIQFIPADVNKHAVIPDADFRYVYDVPDNLVNILKNSCYDCHSNNTNYPWYSYIQPIRLMMDHHVEEGKEELNFSEFGNYSITEQIEKGKMPLPSYLWLHSEATINQSQIDSILSFLNEVK